MPSPAYRDSRGVPETIADLRRHACVTFTGLEASKEWIFREKDRTTRVPVKSRLSVSSAVAAVEATTAGLGVSRLLCYQVSPALADRRLRLVPEKFKAFLDFVVRRMKQKLIFKP